jgi:DNA-binding NtrC family response regulator
LINKPEILVVEDEVNIRTALVTMLEKRGYYARQSGAGEEALTILKDHLFELMITDLKMADLDGLELLGQAKKLYPTMEIIVITAYGSIEKAVEAMRLGAYDFLTKPIDRDRFLMVVDKVLERHRLVAENRELRSRLETSRRFAEMIGESDPMAKVRAIIDMVAGNDVTVLITGESGTGKELVARAIHQKSPRSLGPFLAMNCGAIPETLFESEFFGYEKGAFSGAVGTKPGRLELANRGTLFLDEIGELPVKTQVDFLRVLETGEFRRLGGNKVISVDARNIAATNKKLNEMVELGQFREDLYYRLNVIPIQLPPLRDRLEDLPVLVEHFLKEFLQKHQIQQKLLSLPALRLLRQYSWPGNIRELRNVVERLVVTVREDRIQPEHLPEEIRMSGKDRKTVTIPLGTSLEEMEREVIRRTLVEVTHHRENAAKLLGISVRALQYKIKEYGIEI